MADPFPKPEGAEAPHLSAAAVSAEAARLLASGQCILDAGGHWHGYEIEGPAPGNRAHVYEAINISLMEKVLITAEPLTKYTERRREAWAQLCTRIPPEARILVCTEAIEEDGWRFEVMNRPPAVALREWIACNKADGWTQKHLLQQLAEAVNALHAQGVVHLDIRPDTIFIDDRDNRMEIVLGGLESAMLYNHPRLDVEKVDPFYAPPESVDIGGLSSGIGLRAWDWWGVGRVMQELVLGRHVMSVLFGSDVIREPTPQLRERAEALLHEREPPGVRAGAVEAMGVSDPGTKELLRGLLTSARDARWGGDAVRRWLLKEKVSDHYDLDRNARFFTWKGRGFTLAEAVAFFRTEENWAAGEENISNPNNPESLAHFLSTVPEHQPDWQKIQGVYAQVESAGWSSVPQAARRSITTAVAWLVLGHQPGILVIRGRRIDATGLTDLLSRSQDFYNYTLIKALISAPSVELIKPLDPAAAQALVHLEQVGYKALQLAEQHHWVDPDSFSSQARVLRLALETDSVLRSRADRIRADYASCHDLELANLLADKKPAPWVNVLLVVTGEEPERYGYITRAEYARLHLVGVDTRCQQLRAVVFWRRLRRMLLAGGSCTGDRNSFLVLGMGLTVLGLAVARDAATTACLVAGLAGFRLLLVWRVRVLTHRLDPGALPWTWRDGPARCLTEMQRVWPGEATASLPDLMRQLAEAEEAKAALLPFNLKTPRVASPRLAELWVGLAACALLSILGSVQLVKSYGSLMATLAAAVPPAPPPGLTTTPTTVPAQAPNQVPANPEPPVDPLLKIPGITPEMVAKVRSGEYEIVKEGFGDTLHGPITKWDVVLPPVISPLPVVSRGTATPAQRAFARVSGELLLDPYGRKTINALLIVRVPAREGVALMLYNARERKLADGGTLLLREPPADRTWYQLDRRKVVYLGVPPEMEAENSLALK